MSKVLYFLTPEVEKVQMEFVSRKFLNIGLNYNESQYVKWKKGNSKWRESSLRAFNEMISRKGWISSNKETMEMLGL